jgi:hypothetical protein
MIPPGRECPAPLVGSSGRRTNIRVNDDGFCSDIARRAQGRSRAAASSGLRRGAAMPSQPRARGRWTGIVTREPTAEALARSLGARRDGALWRRPDGAAPTATLAAPSRPAGRGNRRVVGLACDAVGLMRARRRRQTRTQSKSVPVLQIEGQTMIDIAFPSKNTNRLILG